MSKCYFLSVAIVVLALSTHSFGQPGGNASGRSQSKMGVKEYEGVIWEFKAIDHETKKTEKTGRFRVKQDALFLVQVKAKGDPNAKPDDKNAAGPRKVIANKLAGGMEGDPTERIGEIDHVNRTDPGELRFLFDLDDKYELSGRAVVSRVSSKSTIWKGYYDDDKKKRWIFELRKIEE